MFPDYFLEDIVQMLNFTPPPSDRKRKRDKDDDAVGADDEKEVCMACRRTARVVDVTDSFIRDCE